MDGSFGKHVGWSWNESGKRSLVIFDEMPVVEHCVLCQGRVASFSVRCLCVAYSVRCVLSEMFSCKFRNNNESWRELNCMEALLINEVPWRLAINLRERRWGCWWMSSNGPIMGKCANETLTGWGQKTLGIKFTYGTSARNYKLSK